MEKTRLFTGLLAWAIILNLPTDKISGKVEVLPKTSNNPEGNSYYFSNLNSVSDEEPKIVGEVTSPVDIPRRIEIPKIKLDTFIVAVGYNSEREWLVPKERPATPKEELNIGGGKNISIWGHRKGIFKDFDELALGDEIIIFDFSGRYRYQISEKMIVDPKATWVMNATPDYQLTLITCDPPETEEDRLILRATLL